MAKKDLIKLANDAGSDKPPKPIPDKIYDWVLHPENGFYVFNNLNIRTTFHNALITLEKNGLFLMTPFQAWIYYQRCSEKYPEIIKKSEGEFLDAMISEKHLLTRPRSAPDSVIGSETVLNALEKMPNMPFDSIGFDTIGSDSMPKNFSKYRFGKWRLITPEVNLSAVAIDFKDKIYYFNGSLTEELLIRPCVKASNAREAMEKLEQIKDTKWIN